MDKSPEIEDAFQVKWEAKLEFAPPRQRCSNHRKPQILQQLNPLVHRQGKASQAGPGMRISCGGLLLWLMSAAVSAVDLKTLEYPINASLLQPAWLPVQVGALPQDAELTWKFQGKGGNSLSIIARYEANVKRVKYFKDRVKLLDNFTLRIDSVRLEDVGTYTVSVTTPTELQAHVNLRAYEPVSGVRVEVANISSGHPCNLTLSCSAAAGDELNFGWSPGAGSPLGQASDGGDQLLLSLGASDRTDYACTVWNPVSHQTANFTSERVCQQHSVSMDRVTFISAITISICVFLCLTFAIYKFCRRRKSVSLPDRWGPEHNGASVYNDYENTTPQIEAGTVYATVNMNCRS
ncbi:CD276 antigen homolog [Rhinoraja longicauda]